MKAKFFNTALLVSLLFGFTRFSTAQADLKTRNMKSQKVKAAYKKHWEGLRKNIASKGVSDQNFDFYIRVFKQEKKLEAWVKSSSTNNRYVLLRTYDVCASSGVLGPKRRQGDGQVPEGFYKIELLNPYCNYHLGMLVSYPNKSDIIKKTAPDAGNEIMIHGKCCTIGCIPMQDEPAEELYILCLEAMNRNRTVRCDIFPCRMSEQNMETIAKTNIPENKLFWKSIKPGYDFFELNHSLPKISITKKGEYLVTK